MRIFLIFFPFLLFADNLIIKYLNLKPYYYQNQIVNLKFKIISPVKDLNFTSPDVELNVSNESPYIYIVNTKFKADNTPKNIIIISSSINQIINLNSVIKIKQLQPVKNFSNILAENLKIKDAISTLSNNKILLSFTLKCKNCDIKDFHLKNEENITVLNPNEATCLITVPKNIKNFSFYYFNTNSENFKKISVPIKLKEETISTQTDINPNENTFFTPLNILILIIIAFFLVIFLIYQKIWILIFPLIFSGMIIYEFLPKGEIILKRGDKLTILPTYNSTVIYIVKKSQKAKILNKSGNYVEIKIYNKTGWVDENH